MQKCRRALLNHRLVPGFSALILFLLQASTVNPEPRKVVLRQVLSSIFAPITTFRETGTCQQWYCRRMGDYPPWTYPPAMGHATRSRVPGLGFGMVQKSIRVYLGGGGGSGCKGDIHVGKYPGRHGVGML